MDTPGRTLCPSCGSRHILKTRTAANGGYGPTLLPRLGRFMKPAKFDMYVCADCGHASFFVEPETLAHLNERRTEKWRPA